MSIIVECDNRGCREKDFTTMYCEDCYRLIENKLKEAEEKIAELERWN